MIFEAFQRPKEVDLRVWGSVYFVPFDTSLGVSSAEETFRRALATAHLYNRDIAPSELQATARILDFVHMMRVYLYEESPDGTFVLVAREGETHHGILFDRTYLLVKYEEFDAKNFNESGVAYYFDTLRTDYEIQRMRDQYAPGATLERLDRTQWRIAYSIEKSRR